MRSYPSSRLDFQPPYCPGVHKRGKFGNRQDDHDVNMKVQIRVMSTNQERPKTASKPPETKRPATYSCLVLSEDARPTDT